MPFLSVRTVISGLFTGILASALGACASSSGLSEEPGFVAGFGDGCVTAREEEKSFSTKRERDAYLFDTDRAYRAGWRQGHQECQSPYRKVDDGGRILGDEPTF